MITTGRIFVTTVRSINYCTSVASSITNYLSHAYIFLVVYNHDCDLSNQLSRHTCNPCLHLANRFKPMRISSAYTHSAI